MDEGGGEKKMRRLPGVEQAIKKLGH